MIELIGTAAVAGATVIIDHIVELGFDAGVIGIKKKYDQHKLKKALKDYVTSQTKYNEVAALDQEIDYQGIVDFIKSHFLDKVKRRIYEVNPKKRGQAREDIVNSAINYSHAETDASRKNVASFVCSCLDIYRTFYHKHISAKDYIQAADVVDSVNENTDVNASKILDKVNEIQNSLSNATAYSLERVEEDSKNRNLGAIVDRIATQLSVASNYHPLRPYFEYDYINGELVSKPALPEALNKYPERYKFTGTYAHVGDRMFTSWKEMEDYSYRHQLPIILDVTSVKKYLGEIEDPVQPDITRLKDGKLYAYPRKFPDPVPYSILVDGKTYIDYVLLGTQKIEDEGTIVVNNKKQKDTPFFIELRLNGINPKTSTGNIDFKVTIKNGTNRQHLKYSKFMKACEDGGIVTIHMLSKDVDLVKGKISNPHYHSGFKDTDEEVDFLERICTVEDYLGREIQLPETITEGQYRTLLLISDLLRGKDIKERWKDTTITGIIDQHFRESLISMGAGPHRLSLVGNGHRDLFSETVDIRYMQDFQEAYIDDYDRIKKLIKLLNDGDTIKIKLVSGKNDTCIETMNLPERLKEQEGQAVSDDDPLINHND